MNINMKKKALPFEILCPIFKLLPFSDRLICETVCKAWLRAAVACINKFLEVSGTSGVHLLASKLAEDSQNNLVDYSGAAVKKIKILDRNGDDSSNEIL